MKHKKKDLDAIIDNATSGIRDEQIDSSIISQSATRVWARVTQQAADKELTSASHLVAVKNTGSINTMNNNTEQIRGCADVESLIPAYLDGKLSMARTLLFEDHTHECIPCSR
ncbi:MAG: zf-HC2 domain-containing protein, partial [Saprospiraceae bacterium]|nr:zf-HC2 domain-containing protein [Pyrinomonadaceae bacterium]